MNEYRFRFRLILIPAIIGAIIGTVVWFFLTEAENANGGGKLVNWGPPFDTPVIFAMLGANALAIAAVIHARREAKYREKLPIVADQLGLDLELGSIEIPPENRPDVPLFKNWNTCSNRFTGTIADHPAAMFDLKCVESDSEGTSVTRWTVISIDNTDFPAFSCLPKLKSTVAQRALTAAISFDPEAVDVETQEIIHGFQMTYHLSPIKPEEAGSEVVEADLRAFFLAPRLQRLAQCPNWHIQSNDGTLVLASRSILPPEERADLWQGAIDTVTALATPVPSHFSPIPSKPGMAMYHQKRRITAGTMGGIIGSVLGFFGTFIAFVVVMFSNFFAKGPRPAWFFSLFAAFPFIMAAGVGAAAVLGSWIARRRADRTAHLVSPTSPPRVVVDLKWVGFGVVLGWFVGCGLSLLVLLFIFPVLQPDWRFPILFFSPAVICVILGGALGYREGKRRALAKLNKPAVVTEL